MDMSDKSFLANLVSLAARINRGHEPAHNEKPSDALTVVLTDIGSNILTGTDQIADPEHMSLEEASLAACFMAACSVPLVAPFLGTAKEVDVISLMHDAGNRVFCRYDESSRKNIVDSGVLLFREIALAAKGIRKMEEWISSVHNVTSKYVMTEGETDNSDLFAPLYLVLFMATKQLKK